MIWRAVLERWLLFGWIGRLASLAASLYGLGWIAGNLGAASLAHQLLSAALLVGSVLITALIIREIWRSHTSPPRR
jgi:hypothetical protein